VNFGLINKFLLDLQEVSFDIERRYLKRDNNWIGNPLFHFYIERDYEKEMLWKVTREENKRPLLKILVKWDKIMLRIKRKEEGKAKKITKSIKEIIDKREYFTWVIKCLVFCG